MLHLFVVTYSDNYGVSRTAIVAAENSDRARVLAEEAYISDPVEDVIAIETPVVEGVVVSVG